MKFVTMTAAAALIAGTAHAGGINPAPAEPLVMAPVAPAPVMAASDWTGGYAGASLGYGVVNSAGSDLLEDDTATADDFFDADGDGAIGGVFAGYQYDLGNVVVGGELDLNASNLDFDEDGIGDDLDIDGGASIDQVHRLKARVGYDFGNTLVYGTAGAAYAKADIGGTDYDDTGYVLGAGADYKVTETVTVGGEVLYHDFNDFDDTGIDFEATTVQARVSYNF